MLNIKIEFVGEFPPAGNITGLTGRVMSRFIKEGGDLVIKETRGILGTEVVYVLQPSYAKSKSRHPRYRRYSGKDADQPGILSGAMYEGLRARREGTSLIVEVNPSVGFAKGLDYVDWFEARSQFMGKALVLVSRDLAELFDGIVQDELMIKG